MPPTPPPGPPAAPVRRRRDDISGQAVATGASAAALGYASSVAVVVAGLAAVGATPSQVTSGVVALGALMALASVALSAGLRIPVAVVWSTPGAAVLIGVGAVDGGFPAAVGALVVTAALVVATGLVRPLARLVARLPGALTAAVLAGVLLPFCLRSAEAVADLPLACGAIAAVWLAAHRWAPAWSAPAALLALVAVVLATGGVPAAAGDPLTLGLVAPALTADAVVRIALPLYLVTLTGQNLVGVALLAAEGYRPPVGVLLVGTGTASALGALLGAPTMNLAAITGAITAGPQAHPDPARRWVATAANGLTYLVLAVGLAPLAGALVTDVDPRLVATAAGLALLGPLASSAATAVRDPASRLAAVVTLVVTASGVPGAPALGVAAGLVLLAAGRRPGGRGTDPVTPPS